jgi:hypothetical protein
MQPIVGCLACPSYHGPPYLIVLAGDQVVLLGVQCDLLAGREPRDTDMDTLIDAPSQGVMVMKGFSVIERFAVSSTLMGAPYRAVAITLLLPIFCPAGRKIGNKKRNIPCCRRL